MNRSFLRLLAAGFALFPVPGMTAEYLLRVDGLGCLFCAYGIEKRLRTLDGVKEAGFTLRALSVLEDGGDGTAAPKNRMAAAGVSGLGRRRKHRPAGVARGIRLTGVLAETSACDSGYNVVYVLTR